MAGIRRTNVSPGNYVDPFENLMKADSKRIAMNEAEMARGQKDLDRAQRMDIFGQELGFKEKQLNALNADRATKNAIARSRNALYGKGTGLEDKLKLYMVKLRSIRSSENITRVVKSLLLLI